MNFSKVDDSYDFMNPTQLKKLDFYGVENKANTCYNNFDHQEELETMLIPLASCQISTLTLWFSSGDIQNITLRGIKADFKKWNDGEYFDSMDYVSDKAKLPDKDNKEPDFFSFEVGEYIKSIKLVISETVNAIAGLEFTTTLNNRSIVACGILHNPEAGIKLPTGKKIEFDFEKENGYLVGFYGQYDSSNITYLGGYMATFKTINYYIRRPYIIPYKMFCKKKELLDEIALKFKLERDVNNRFKNAILTHDNRSGNDGDGSNNGSKILLYLYDVAITNYDLFKHVCEYLA